MQARSSGGNDKSGDAPCPWYILATSEDNIEISNTAIGDPGFCAIELIVITQTCGSGCQGGGIRASSRFGEGKSGDPFARGDVGKIVSELIGGTGESDCATTKSLHSKREISQSAVIGERFTNDTEGA